MSVHSAAVKSATPGQWPTASQGEWGSRQGDDGGWSQGPPATGSGWGDELVARAKQSPFLFPVSGTANGNRDMSSGWQNLTESGSSSWQRQNLVFDKNDQEAWPSIGDKSENTSENGDDNASVKSGSVISSSSNQGQGLESSQDPSTSSAMQGQSASSLWSTSSSFNVESNWGLTAPSSSAANTNSFGWGSAPPSSLSMNNQGLNMQSGASSAGGDTLNSNPMLGASKPGWGAPGTVPQGQAPGGANRMPPVTQGNPQIAGLGNNMQGTLPVSGAQPNGPQFSVTNSSVSVQQGNSGAFQATSGWNTSSGIVMNPGTSIKTSSDSAQSGDNLSSAWGAPGSNDNSKVPPGTSQWGNPNPSQGSDWGATLSQSQQMASQFRNPNTPSTVQGPPNPQQQQRPSSWAQAAGKGLNLTTNNPGAGAAGSNLSEAEQQKQELIRQAVESHDGWGQNPIRQDTVWNLESPKAQRKFSSTPSVPAEPKGASNSNMWNNNNGTAIWEANKDGTSAWNSSAAAASRAPGPGPGWEGPAKPPNSEPRGNNWGGGNMSDKSIGAWGSDQQNSNWSAKTELGSWNTAGGPGNNGGGGGIATWGENPGSNQWEDPSQAARQSGPKDGTSFWGEPATARPPPQGWTSAGTPNIAQMQQMKANEWNSGGKPKNMSGWGSPMPADPKIDDGTSLWAANNQQQAQAAGWGDTGQWNPGKPKPPGPAGWGGPGGDNDMNWNNPDRKDDMMWNSDGMGGWDDADMGTWNDTTQETNSAWNSATGWNPNRRPGVKVSSLSDQGGGPMKFPGGGGHPPQMRSRLLQQMMDLGFKKDEAQHALINNNMNLQNALADLYSRQGASANRKDTDIDVFQMDGAKTKIPGILVDSGATEDISDTQSDSNSFVPNFNSMQNTQFQNAQVPNQFPFNKGPSLPPSSLNPNNPSITLQQKILQQKIQLNQQQQQPPPPPTLNSVNQAQGQQMGRVPTQTAVQQQMAQQQILQQLRMAVQAGLISPQLLNQQLPPHVLVMLQQLLQQQQMLQQLITTQQMLQQNKMGLNPVVQRQQLEQVAVRINSIKSQILVLQKQIAHAQAQILKPNQQHQQPLSVTSQESDASNVSLPNEMSALSLATNTAAANTQPAKSRLDQWKRTTPDKETSEACPVGSGDGGLNKAVGSAVGSGSKQIHQSQSTPNLRAGGFDQLGLSNLVGGDPTWSAATTSSSQNWPNSSSVQTSASQSESSVSSDIKESQPSVSSTTVSSSVLNINDSIPEFVPGKPWQGITKNVEDDPHITPGSYSRSLSVNTIKDDYLTSLTKSSPNETTSTWPTKTAVSGSNPSGKPWSAGDSAPTSFSSEVWGVPFQKGGMSRPPPGLPLDQRKVGSGSNWSGLNRTQSWTPGTRVDTLQGSSGFSTSLFLKNLTPQTDASTLRTLCMQHGPLQSFYMNLNHGQALVKYSTREEAMKAQRSLNTCVLGNTTIVAEFVSDVEAARFEQQSAMSAPSQWSQPNTAMLRQAGAGQVTSGRNDGNSSWNAPNASFNNPLPGQSSNMWGGGVGGGMGSGGLWGVSLEDHTTNNLLGNMLGETM